MMDEGGECFIVINTTDIEKIVRNVLYKYKKNKSTSIETYTDINRVKDRIRELVSKNNYTKIVLCALVDEKHLNEYGNKVLENKWDANKSTILEEIHKGLNDYLNEIKHELKKSGINTEVDVKVGFSKINCNKAIKDIILLDTHDYTILEEYEKYLKKHAVHPKKEMLFKAFITGILSAGTYIFIFSNYKPVFDKLLHQGIISAPILLVIIMWIAFIYGSTISFILKALGISPKH